MHNRLPLFMLAFLVQSVSAITDVSNLLPLIITSGFLDGIHPCGLAVLFFFIALLLMMKKPRKEMLLIGLAYIFGVFVAYLLIGIGILKVFTFFPTHFMAKLGASMLLIVGAISIWEGLSGKKAFKLPSISRGWIDSWLRKSTATAALVAGFIVGVCAFPCAGGIYVAILGIIASKFAFWEGIGYLLLYNVMFVMPLILVLLVSTNSKILLSIERMEKENRKKLKLLLGALMIMLALFILFGGVLQ
ncbi:MAG: cytochrome c biogenesis protein CcdA [Candidatus Micrarchaeota archaeon]